MFFRSFSKNIFNLFSKILKAVELLSLIRNYSVFFLLWRRAASVYVSVLKFNQILEIAVVNNDFTNKCEEYYLSTFSDLYNFGTVHYQSSKMYVRLQGLQTQKQASSVKMTLFVPRLAVSQRT